MSLRGFNLNEKKRLAKLANGSETAKWAYDKILEQDEKIKNLELNNLSLRLEQSAISEKANELKAMIDSLALRIKCCVKNPDANEIRELIEEVLEINNG